MNRAQSRRATGLVMRTRPVVRARLETLPAENEDQYTNKTTKGGSDGGAVDSDREVQEEEWSRCGSRDLESDAYRDTSSAEQTRGNGEEEKEREKIGQVFCGTGCDEIAAKSVKFELKTAAANKVRI
jgi:hypothetical protein